MDKREKVIQALEHYKTMYIFRAADMNIHDVIQAVEAVKKGGGKLIEITYSHKNDGYKQSIQAIEALKCTFPDLYIGAGTILTKEETVQCLQAGADFIVSPSLHKEVIDTAHSFNTMCMPGACTSTEVVHAQAWGADFVKLFPAGVLGIEYAKAIMKPLNFIRYFAVCNMNDQLFEQFLNIGFSGAGISSCINDPQIISEKRFDIIEQRVRRYTEIAARY